MKKTNDALTEKQFKTLRRLLLIWFKVFVRRRYSILLNLLLGVSLALNIWFFIPKDQKIQLPISIEKPIDLNSVLDLNNYPSVSNPSQTLAKRFSRLYKNYLDDKSSPDYSHYIKNTRTINSDWSTHCRSELRKIISIKARVKDLELILDLNYPDRDQEIEVIIQEKRYGELLADMSNYYAKFISLGDYKYLVNTSD